MVKPGHEMGPDRIFVVREGSTLREVVADLEKRGIIDHKELLLLWGRVMGYGRKIKAGEYLLNRAMPPIRVIDILRTGLVVTHKVTVPEGFTMRQIGELLEKKGLLGKEEFLAVTGDPDMAKKIGISGPNLEGYLYPDTYYLGGRPSAKAIADIMTRQFFEVVEPFQKGIDESGMSLEEVITLASIVEKETGLADERPLIAGVLLNRLNKGMRLESDPTVIYGISDFNGNLTKKDLAAHTPFNTYLIRGLPLGPIANPGRESIRAVLNPAGTACLYFVSKNDGSHHFSATLSEHNRAVNTYQRKRAQKRSVKRP